MMEAGLNPIPAFPCEGKGKLMETSLRGVFYTEDVELFAVELAGPGSAIKWNH